MPSRAPGGRRAFRLLGLLVAWLAASLPSTTPAGATDVQVTERVSVATGGAQGNGRSETPVVSGDGELVAFDSLATNLVAGDTNRVADVFVRGRGSAVTERLSVGPGGAQANGGSWEAALSGDGRYTAFSSVASNLVVGDTNAKRDVFVRDRLTAQTTMVSVSSIGGLGDGDSRNPFISADGRYVAFESLASTLVAGDTNALSDVFVHDRLTASTTRVSVDSAGNQANDGSRWLDISDDGRFVAFSSWAPNLVPGKSAHTLDVFVHDRQTGATSRVSQDAAGGEANGSSLFPAISGDGRFVTFHSSASDLVAADTNAVGDVFVHDRSTGQTSRVSVDSTGAQGNDGSAAMSISDDGRFVAFDSRASNLVANDTNGAGDSFVHDRQTGHTTRVSVSSTGVQGNATSQFPVLSGDGRFVVFDSLATNLVAGDTNSARDAFVRWVSEPPAAPLLVAPEAYGRFELGEEQVFTIRAVDPEGDSYHGVVTVTDRTNGEVVSTFTTSTAASGSDSSGRPTSDLPLGEYRWSAVAQDALGSTGPRSAEAVFGVVAQPNRPPAVPTLAEPADGATYAFGQPEVFAVHAVDPDNDLYYATVVVTNAETGEITTFQTRPTASGTESRGRPFAPLLPGNYTWKSRTVDMRGEQSGSFSAERAFEVVTGGSLLVL